MKLTDIEQCATAISLYGDALQWFEDNDTNMHYYDFVANGNIRGSFVADQKGEIYEIDIRGETEENDITRYYRWIAPKFRESTYGTITMTKDEIERDGLYHVEIDSEKDFLSKLNYPKEFKNGQNIDESGLERWYLNNNLHREDGPAILGEYYQAWFQNGVRHREDGPAIVGQDYQIWFRNGVMHREDGPAFLCEHEEKLNEYWIHGEKFSEEEVKGINRYKQLQEKLNKDNKKDFNIESFREKLGINQENKSKPKP